MHRLHKLHIQKSLTKRTVKINALHTKCIKLIIALFSLFFIILVSTAGAEATDNRNPVWESIFTRYTIIHYQSEDDLRKFNTNIQYNLTGPELKKQVDPVDSLGFTKVMVEKIDAIFNRAQEILEMHGVTNKIHIKIYKNSEQLNQAFFDLFKTQGSARAWYTHEKNTVYVQLNDLQAGMLAHEFAHAVIDHYLIVPPPSGTAEILARYVDKHLVPDITKTTGDGDKLGQVTGYTVK